MHTYRVTVDSGLAWKFAILIQGPNFVGTLYILILVISRYSAK